MYLFVEIISDDWDHFSNNNMRNKHNDISNHFNKYYSFHCIENTTKNLLLKLTENLDQHEQKQGTCLTAKSMRWETYMLLIPANKKHRHLFIFNRNRTEQTNAKPCICSALAALFLLFTDWICTYSREALVSDYWYVSSSSQLNREIYYLSTNTHSAVMAFCPEIAARAKPPIVLSRFAAILLSRVQFAMQLKKCTMLVRNHLILPAGKCMQETIKKNGCKQFSIRLEEGNVHVRAL